MLGTLIFLAVVGSTIWVGVDASQRQWPQKGGFANSTSGWVLSCALLWIVAFPLYLSRRNRAPLKTAQAAGPSATAVALPPPTAPPHGKTHRECPHCKEPMRRDAHVCPHCRHESPAWRWHEGFWWLRASEQEPWEWFDERSDSWVTTPQAAALAANG